MPEHLWKIEAKTLNASSISRRLRALNQDKLNEVSEALLGRIGDPENNPEGYYSGMRLIGIDATRFTLKNTEAILKKIPKANTRRSRSEKLTPVAFPDIYASSLVELGPHNPLAIRVGMDGESEQELARELVPGLKHGDMLLGDRLYGQSWFVHLLSTKWDGGVFLLKVPSNQTSRELERLEDGSSIVEVDVRMPGQRSIVATHRLREIRYEITSTDAEGVRQVDIYRLWTNLMDCRLHPGGELINLYTSRWEHEGYYGELKNEMKTHKYLNAQIPETVPVEICAMVWASALIARERQRIAEQSKAQSKDGTSAKSAEVRRISFGAIHQNMQILWELHRQVGRSIDARQFQSIVDDLSNDIAIFKVSKRSRRTCPRKVRQNMVHWPKLRERTQSKEPVQIRILDKV